MNTRNNIIGKQYRNQLNGFDILRLFSFLFIGFVFLWIQSSSLAENFSIKGGVQKENTIFLSNFASISNNSHLSFPFESKPLKQDKEVPFEYELDEEYEQDENLDLTSQTFEHKFNISSGNNNRTELLNTTSSGITIPFFILYHSWKSFLS